MSPSNPDRMPARSVTYKNLHALPMLPSMFYEWK